MNDQLVTRVRNRLTLGAGGASREHVGQALREEGIVLSEVALAQLITELEREFYGAGVLQPLLDDPRVSDVLVNSPNSVWCDRGSGLEKVDVTFGSEADVRRLAQRLATGVGRRLDDASPMVDAQLPDGTRLHCVLQPISTHGTTISLRVPPKKGFDLDYLVRCGSIDTQVRDLLRSMIEKRVAFVVSGGTGSGKTTVLSALLGEVPHHQRIVIAEDSAELKPDHPHVVCMQSRMANVEGKGAITLRDLVRTSLRMRPDRIVVGEVRGAEVIELLSALNTGHEGGCGTVHANSPQDVPARLEALGLTAGIDRVALHALMGSGLDAIVHIHRDSRGQRRVQGIHLTRKNDSGFVSTDSAIEFDGSGWSRGPAWSELELLLDSRVA